MISFKFTWFKNEKYGTPIERHNVITLSKPNKDIKKSAELATEIFKKSFGSLKKNTIISIYPLDKNGEPFGEAITLTNV